MAVNGVAGVPDIMPQAALQTERSYTSQKEPAERVTEVRDDRQDDQPEDETRGTLIDTKA